MTIVKKMMKTGMKVLKANLIQTFLNVKKNLSTSLIIELNIKGSGKII